MWKLFILMVVFLAGCTIPATVLFRNFSNETVRLQATITDRYRFDKIPNKVTFYDTATKKREFYGTWRSSGLVTWTNSISFYMDVPAFTVVDVKDISNGLTLGSRQPEVLLVMIGKTKSDTLTKGDYLSLAKKFRSTGYGMFRTPVYYYDLR